MVKITVRLLATLKSLAGSEYFTLNVESPITLKELLEKLSGIVGDKAKERLFKKGSIELQPDILVLVNDVEIGVLNGLDTILKEGDVVSFLPTVHGG
ncbi:MAG: MoaD/ThiS family protein [archaeon GB-1867-035]|nr:MoaD/ThiS family protein [Candidatus Culexmicrobium profundum]